MMNLEDASVALIRMNDNMRDLISVKSHRTRHFVLQTLKKWEREARAQGEANAAEWVRQTHESLIGFWRKEDRRSP